MQKKKIAILISLLLFSLVLSGCKMPASKAPKVTEDAGMTTPFAIITVPSVSSDEETPQISGTEEPGNQQEGVTEGFITEPTEIPTPTIMVPTVTRPAEYAIKEGENAYCIARRFDLDPTALLELNNLTPNTLLSPGTILKIPQTGSWGSDDRSLRAHPATHIVASGDTIYSIACFYGDVSPEAIIAVNQLKEPYELTTGQTLEIP
jgi:LysM repeat protein